MNDMKSILHEEYCQTIYSSITFWKVSLWGWKFGVLANKRDVKQSMKWIFILPQISDHLNENTSKEIQEPRNITSPLWSEKQKNPNVKLYEKQKCYHCA